MVFPVLAVACALPTVQQLLLSVCIPLGPEQQWAPSSYSLLVINSFCNQLSLSWGVQSPAAAAIGHPQLDAQP